MERYLKSTMIAVSVLLLLTKITLAQDITPFSQSTYAGVSALSIQPASIADSRYRFDMTLLGLNTSFNNNYIALKREAVFKTGNWSDKNFGDNYLVENLDNKDKTGIFHLGAVLPSFMINISENSAIAFSSRIRSITNVDNITQDFARLVAEDFDYEPLLYRTLTNANFSFQTNTWSEIGVSFATILLNKQKHFLKGGATIKYLQGIASGYAFIRELNYRFDGSDTISLFQSKINYGLSSNFEEDGIKPFNVVSDPGVGFDIGFVYEFRPDIDNFKYQKNGREDLLRPDKEKYKLRVGLSLLDFGRINYKKGYYSQDFIADVRDWNVGDIQINSVQDLNDTLRNRFHFDDNAEQTFLMGLPTALSLQIDYQVIDGFYLNFSPYLALRKGTNMTTKTHYFTNYSFTPRYDLKWFGVALPLQFDQFNRINSGIGFRLGPVWIGSNSIFSNVFSKKSYGTDVYMAIKIPVFRNIDKDMDQDGISDKDDKCPEIAGLWELNGCPDTDGDGIADQDDLCPYDKGLATLFGCPDRDMDGIADKNDKCPDHFGLIENDGCPDTDKDGIVDFDDACPEQAGPAELRGCPDRDNDGIADKDDLCPDLAGKPEFKGCPFADSDNDGIADDQDECPAQPGPAMFNGCPDTDNDGIPDKSDLCPNTPGVAENKGCPPILKEETEILNRAFSNLEFESGKSVIKAVSYPSLDELASLLIKKEMWKVKLSGHTDNTGNPDKNMELSKNRTQAVKDYLIKSGVKEFRIKTEWFGQEKPIADNKTAAGRQKNRRVEMEIIFE